MEGVIIRKGTKADLPDVHALVVELAIYEKEPNAVIATLDDYQKDFEAGIFQTLIAEKGGKTLGMMLYFMTYSTWKGKMMYLDDFVVKESSRGMGIGQLLYDQFIVESKKAGAKLVKWQVLNWNKPAISFYKKNETIIEDEWYNVKKFI